MIKWSQKRCPYCHGRPLEHQLFMTLYKNIQAMPGRSDLDIALVRGVCISSNMYVGVSSNPVCRR